MSRFKCKHCPSQLYNKEEAREHAKNHEEMKGTLRPSCNWFVALAKMGERDNRNHNPAIAEEVVAKPIEIAALEQSLANSSSLVVYECRKYHVESIPAEGLDAHRRLHRVLDRQRAKEIKKAKDAELELTRAPGHDDDDLDLDPFSQFVIPPCSFQLRYCRWCQATRVKPFKNNTELLMHFKTAGHDKNLPYRLSRVNKEHITPKHFHYKCIDCSALIKKDNKELRRHLMLHECCNGPPSLNCLVCGRHLCSQ